MSTEKNKKLNQLISNWVKGTVYTQKYLSQLGYNHDLVKKYRRNDWFVFVGSGAYKLTGDNIDWYGGLYAIQTQLQSKIHIGGKTALELQGYAHYLSEQLNKSYLFGESGEKLPAWFKSTDWGLNVELIARALFTKDFNDGLTNFTHKEFIIKISAPERAILEMLYLVPGNHGFDECYRIMENLTTLRPEVVQELLENCRSVKTKRLFLYMADKAEHAWMDRINAQTVDLGSGKRVIVQNGMLDKKYNITVPRDFQ